jgi:tryptophan halogenase
MLNVNKIVIVGGGSAGWMSAAAMIKFFPEKDITVIESPNISPIGVGESTYDGIRYFCTLLEIDNKDFFSYTDASVKLGITFSDFYEKEGYEDFQYPFGFPYVKNTKWGLEDWMIRKVLYPETPVNDFAESYFPQAHLAKYGRFSENKNGEFNNFNPILDTALHFDAIKFGSWLREKYCIPRGVKHIVDEVKEVKVDENGVSSLEMSSGSTIKSDLYIDCTGFKGLLITQALKEPFISYSDILPNNRAWATQVEYKDKEKELRSVTTCTAMSNGWIWDIPLWSRLGTGYVYSDKFISKEEALEEFKNYLCSQKMVVPRTREEVDSLVYRDIPMRVGIHERVWVKNVVGIGLSAGFIEPLESNGLFTVYEFLYQLIRSMLRGPAVNQWDIDSFNHEAKDTFDGFVNFIRIHYSLSIRQDSEYWIANSKRTFNFDGYDFSNEFSSHILSLKKAKTHTFVPPGAGGVSWISSGLHYHILDEVSVKLGELKNRMNYKVDLDPFFKELDIKKQIWAKNALESPTMYRYLKETFYE